MSDEHGFSAHVGCIDEDDDATIIKKLRDDNAYLHHIINAWKRFYTKLRDEIAVLTGINRAQANIIEQIHVELQRDAPDLEFIAWLIGNMKTYGGGH